MQLPIVAALVVAVAPHLPRLPPWMILWCLGMWGYLLLREKTGWPLPGPVVRYLLVFAGIAGILASFRLHIGPDAFVGLMAVMAGIKPFEMATRRHQIITLLLSYFMIITSLFRSDSLWIVLYMLFSVWVTTGALVSVHNPGSPIRTSLSLAGRMLARSLPVVILLFLVFPRLQHGLVGGAVPGSGRSGFSESLQPGSVASVARDPSVAFRVALHDPLPRDTAWYWRGIVFDRVDSSGQWQVGPESKSGPAIFRDPDIRVSQTVILEPHGYPWLFALDRPVQAPADADLTRGSTLRARERVARKKTYTVVSSPDPAGPESPAPLPVAISPRLNPRTRDLARDLTRDRVTVRDRVDAILGYFAGQGFAYTLTPPRMPGPHILDEFMFEAKRGYCEHYAVTLAFLLSARGDPARVVGGYLGGETNPYSDYITVRQAFAHVWVEVYDPGTGWFRVDPTLAVAPERRDHHPDGSPALFRILPADIPLLSRMGFFLEAVNLSWEAWFIGYSFATQQALVRRLGALAGHPGMSAVWALAFLVPAGIGIYLWPGRPRSQDPVRDAYLRFCDRLARVGLVRNPGQGPLTFAHQVGRVRPDLARAVDTITRTYIRLRYENAATPDLIREFLHQVRHFRPGKSRK